MTSKLGLLVSPNTIPTTISCGGNKESPPSVAGNNKVSQYLLPIPRHSFCHQYNQCKNQRRSYCPFPLSVCMHVNQVEFRVSIKKEKQTMDRRRGDVFGNERNALYINHKREKRKVRMKMPRLRKIGAKIGTEKET